MSEVPTEYPGSKLARLLGIREQHDGKRRLRQALWTSLGILALGVGSAILEPGGLNDPALTIENTKTHENILTISEGDRTGSVGVVVGAGLAGVAGYGLILIRREEQQGASGQPHVS